MEVSFIFTVNNYKSFFPCKTPTHSGCGFSGECEVRDECINEFYYNLRSTIPENGSLVYGQLDGSMEILRPKA